MYNLNVDVLGTDSKSLFVFIFWNDKHYQIYKYCLLKSYCYVLVYIMKQFLSNMGDNIKNNIKHLGHDT